MPERCLTGVCFGFAEIRAGDCGGSRLCFIIDSLLPGVSNRVVRSSAIVVGLRECLRGKARAYGSDFETVVCFPVRVNSLLAGGGDEDS
jgi:hypothetical protein